MRRTNWGEACLSEDYVEHVIVCVAAKRPIALRCTKEGIVTCQGPPKWNKCKERKLNPQNCAMKIMADKMAPALAKTRKRNQQMRDVSLRALLGLTKHEDMLRGVRDA